MRTTAPVHDLPQRPTRVARRREQRPAAPRSHAAHDPAVVEAMRSGDPRALRSAHPDTIRRLQRSVGNAGLSSALAQPRRALERAPGPRLQREDGDEESVPSKTKTVVSGASDLTGEASNVAGLFATSTSATYDVQATYVGAGAALLSTGLELISTAGESYDALHVLLDPAQPQDAQEAALDVLGDSVRKVWRSKDTVTSNVSSIVTTATGSVPAATVASSFGLVAAYGDFASSLVSWGTDWMALQDIQELQFTGWSVPARAAAEALGDTHRAKGLLAGAERIQAAATKVHGRNALAHAAAYASYLLQLQTAADMRRMEGERVSSEHAVYRAGVGEAEEDRANKRRDEYLALGTDVAVSAAAVAAADKRVAQAREIIARAAAKEQAVKIFAHELQTAIEFQRAQPDPQHRHVPLAEIRQFAISQGEKKLTRDTLKVIASVIGLAAGIVILALGWTPVGWGLVAAAGAIGAGILVYKTGGWVLRKLTGAQTPREVYAARLWNYAHYGYDFGHAQAPPKDVRHRTSADAVGLLHALGVSWSVEDVVNRPAGEFDSAIGAIENKLKW